MPPGYALFVAEMMSSPLAIEPDYLKSVAPLLLYGQRDFQAVKEAEDRRALLDPEGSELLGSLPQAILGIDSGSGTTSYLAQKIGSVAVINLFGPIYPKANLVSNASGGTSLEILKKTLNQAWADPSVKSVVLRTDSPGGSTYGVAELAEAIFQAPKPTYAHASGTCASAAYWIASGCQGIYANQGALIGSIGVLIQYTDKTRARESAGFDDYVVVSKKSPYKTTTPADPQGAKKYQALVDAMADQFIAAVATYRGTTTEAVSTGYGQGFILSGTAATEATMVDGLLSLDQLVNNLNQDPTAPDGANVSTQENIMAGNETNGVTPPIAAEPNPAPQDAAPAAETPNGSGAVAATQASVLESMQAAQTQMLERLDKMDASLTEAKTEASESKTQVEALKEENAQLKTQLEAYGQGIDPKAMPPQTQDAGADASHSGF